MRRVVRDYVTASIDRVKPQLERYIVDHLQYPEPFPFIFSEPVASILEAELEMRTFAIDVELDALGTVQGYGYNVG